MYEKKNREIHSKNPPNTLNSFVVDFYKSI